MKGIDQAVCGEPRAGTAGSAVGQDGDALEERCLGCTEIEL